MAAHLQVGRACETNFHRLGAVSFLRAIQKWAKNAAGRRWVVLRNRHHLMSCDVLVSWLGIFNSGLPGLRDPLRRYGGGIYSPACMHGGRPHPREMTTVALADDNLGQQPSRPPGRRPDRELLLFPRFHGGERRETRKPDDCVIIVAHVPHAFVRASAAVEFPSCLARVCESSL